MKNKKDDLITDLEKMKPHKREFIYCKVGKKESLRVGFQYHLNESCYEEWMKYCNVNNVNDIDYNNPNVAVEFTLNDPYYRNICIYGSIEEKESILYTLFDDEMKKLYFIDSGDGVPYCCLEKKDRGIGQKRYLEGHYNKMLQSI